MKKLSILISSLLIISLLLCSCKVVSEPQTQSFTSSDTPQSASFSDTQVANTETVSQSKTNDISDTVSSEESQPSTVSEPDNNNQLNQGYKSPEEAAADFAVNILKLTADKDRKNSMVSPLSLLIALGMTANGAQGETLKEMESVMYGGDIKNFNAYYKVLIERIQSDKNCKISIANSIWYHNDQNVFKINDDFTKLIKDSYSGDVQGIDFKQKSSVTKINDWVKNKTNNKINGIIDEIPDEAVIYLINALYFDAKWQRQYNELAVSKRVFHSVNGDVEANFMYSEESEYIKTKDAVGFSKKYEGGKFSFVAVMPDEGTTVEKYLSDLDGNKLLNILKERQFATGKVRLPKFKAEFECSAVDPLKQMGIKRAFGDADLRLLGTSAYGNLAISNVIHKTFIEVNEAGTVAAAVTAVEVGPTCLPSYAFDITLDRPFIYMIIDEQTQIPLFIGIMNNPK